MGLLVTSSVSVCATLLLSWLQLLQGELDSIKAERGKAQRKNLEVSQTLPCCLEHWGILCLALAPIQVCLDLVRQHCRLWRHPPWAGTCGLCWNVSTVGIQLVHANSRVIARA